MKLVDKFELARIQAKYRPEEPNGLTASHFGREVRFLLDVIDSALSHPPPPCQCCAARGCAACEGGAKAAVAGCRCRKPLRLTDPDREPGGPLFEEPCTSAGPGEEWVLVHDATPQKLTIYDGSDYRVYQRQGKRGAGGEG